MFLQRVFLLFSATTYAWQYVFTDSESTECEDRCFTTEVGAFQTVRGPIWLSTSPRDHLERAVLSAVNGSAWEQWYFDVVSSSADQSLGLCVSRDPSYKVLGQGILRVEFFIQLKNGTIIGGTDFVHSSSVQECCGEVRGEWKSVDRSYSFHISKDMNRVEAEFRRPDVSGSFLLESITHPRYSDGSMWPSDTANHEVSPLLHITEPMPAGNATVSFTVLGDKPVRWSGIGGHNRIWSSKDWFGIVKGWHNARAKVGPYVISVFEDVSKIDGNMYQGTVLFKNGVPVLRSTMRGPLNESRNEDYHRITRRHNGKISSTWGDNSTGWTLDFISPRRGKHWQFLLQHERRPFEVTLGEGKGLAGFTDLVSGGEIGGEQYTDGFGVTEQVLLPDKMSLKLMLTIWWQLVTGSGTNPVAAIWQMVSAAFK